MRQFISGLAGLLLLGAVLLLATGCGTPRPKTSGTDPAKVTEPGKKAEHDHPHEGPNEGALAEWGEEKYHAEFTVDHDKKQATVYILDGTAKKAAPISSESIKLVITNLKPALELTLKKDPETTDPAGKSSRFTGKDDQLAKVMEFKGQISGVVDGTPYSGKFEEKAHDHKDTKKTK